MIVDCWSKDSKSTWKQPEPCSATACTSCLVIIGVVAFWQGSVWAGKDIIPTSFSTAETEKGKWLPLLHWHRKNCQCSHFVETVLQFQNVMRINVPLNHSLIHCNYAQPLCVCVSVCKWMLPFTTLGYTVITLMTVSCNAICVCPSIWLCILWFRHANMM